MAKTSLFDASASMLGYIYQIRYALYLSLKKLPDLEDPENFNVSIEKLDDIAFDKNGSPEEILQTKFHGSDGNLSDRSSDIWKTVRVWVESMQSGNISLGKTILTLVTTQTVVDETLACYLGCGPKRNLEAALQKMSEICQEVNVANGKGYNAFEKLSTAEKQSFLSSIYIIGKSEDLLRIRDKMKPIARQSVPVQAVDAFLERLEGKWFKWAIEALSHSPLSVINLGELQETIDNLRPDYSITNLPAEYADALPNMLELESDARSFIRQLRLFGAPKRLIELAVINYYRAFEQRNKWSGSGLLNPGELELFDRKLVEKWLEEQAFLEMEESSASEDARKKYSARLYQRCQQQGIVPIRSDFIEEYLSKGSYHILSDDLKIGWHPNYKELLQASNEDAA